MRRKYADFIIENANYMQNSLKICFGFSLFAKNVIGVCVFFWVQKIYLFQMCVTAQFLLYAKRFLVLNFFCGFSFFPDSCFAFTLLFNLTLNLEIKCT